MATLRPLRAALAAAVLLLSLSPLAARADDDPAALLAKHKAYVGWQFGDGTFKTFEIKGTSTTAAGKQVDHWTTLQAGVIFRTVGKTADYGFTGNVFWDSDDNGFTHPDYSDNQKFLISQTILFSEGTTLLPGTLVGQKSVGSASFPVVRVTAPHGDAIDVYVDPSTGAYRRAVIDPDGTYETTYDIVSYAEVLPGKRMIDQYHQDGSTDLVALTIKPNVVITPEQVHPPAQVATWTFANPNPFKIDVKPKFILFDATVNGVKGRFLLDTGAGGIFLSDAFANRAHIKSVGSSEAIGTGGEVRTTIRKADTIEIGGNTLSNVRIDTGDFSDNDEGQTIDGFMGYPVFGGAVVTLNTGAQTMTIADPQTGTVDKNFGYNVFVDLSDETPVVPMTIDDRVKVSALLDMGNSGFVLASKDLVTKRNIPMLASENEESDPRGYFESHLVMEGAGGEETPVKCSTIQSIALGPIAYQSTFACFSPRMTGDQIIVGYDFLKQFDYIFDYREGLIIMKPHAQ